MKTIIKEIDKARDRVIHFFENIVNRDDLGLGIKKCSTYHDVARYPDMTLVATYNATNALCLLNYYKDKPEARKSIADFINSYQREDGRFRFKNMKEHQIYKINDLDYTWEYIDFHISNYSIGALNNLGYKPKYQLEFIKKYQSMDALNNWLDKRIMTDPWLEGNNVVNLASFYIHELEGKNDDLLKVLMDRFIRWHRDTQDPKTGYWGTNLEQNPASALYGMAGAAHNYHLYYYYNEKIDYIEPIVDYCIDYTLEGFKSACLDIDVVDILVNMIPYGYRVNEIKAALEKMLKELLSKQNSDGGFPDTNELTAVRRMDGWVEGYWEPQGLSNCFATWFRLATIGMIDCALHEERRHLWSFRNTIGIGYYNKNYLEKGGK